MISIMASYKVIYFRPGGYSAVAAPPSLPSPPPDNPAPGREEAYAQEAAEWEAIQKVMASGGKCPLE